MIVNKSSMYNIKAFSIIEIIIAAALFIIFSSGAVGIILFGLDMNRLGGEQTIANQYASEGLEAIRSIKNQNFSNLVNTSATGISRSGGVWTLSGTNNTFDKYTRTISISDSQRDVMGNIVSSGGTIDPSTKIVISTVSWNVSGSRNNSVVLTTYIANWKGSILTSTPTPTPFSTCNSFAVSQGYSSGICRQSVVFCTKQGEINLASGDVYCVSGSSADTCCAVVGPTPTLPSSTPTPIPTSAPVNCNQYCLITYGRSGLCARSNQCASPKINAGRIYECVSPKYCCCQ